MRNITTNLHFLPDGMEELRLDAREFGDKIIRPAAAAARAAKNTPPEVLDAMREKGYFGLSVPEEFGGLGFSYANVGGIIEELSMADTGTTVVIPVHNSLFVDAILMFGTQEQKENYLPRAASGEIIGANCITEPGAGTDVGSMAATAVDNGDYWLVNGDKQFITNATIAGAFIFFAKTDPEAGGRGISAFIIDADTPGLTIGKPESKISMPASVTAGVNLLDVQVPKENLLGELGKGFKIAMTVLNGGRIEMAFQSVGLAQEALNLALAHCRERKQFGKPISAFQISQQKMARMAMLVNQARLAAYHAAGVKDKGHPYAREAAMAKLFCSEVAHEVINDSLQLHGGNGLMGEYRISDLYLDQRVTEIYEGTSEAQILTIAGDLAKQFETDNPQ